ncbi:hypothetical protein V8B97DRAFT_1919191 [Scleroderma yunnanense]
MSYTYIFHNILEGWLLLVTVYGPIVILQLWNICLKNAQQGSSLTDHLVMIAKQKSKKVANKEKKKIDAQVLKKAHFQGKKSLATEKASEKAVIEEAKKTEKLRLVMKKMKKAQNAEKKQEDEIDDKCILHPNDLLNFL